MLQMNQLRLAWQICEDAHLPEHVVLNLAAVLGQAGTTTLVGFVEAFEQAQDDDGGGVDASTLCSRWVSTWVL